MSVRRIPSHNPFFSNPSLTPTSLQESSDSSIFDQSFYARPNQQLLEQAESKITTVWEHFFQSMPLSSDQRTWERFFDDQDALEIRLGLKEPPQVIHKTVQNQKSAKSQPMMTQNLSLPCPVGCGSSFTRRRSLKKHFKAKHSDQSDLVEKHFIDNKLTIKNEKTVPCPISDCPSGFSRRRDLLQHVSKMHPGRDDLIKHLKAKYLYQPDLAEGHFKDKLTIKNEKTYPCPISDCPSGFSRRRDLFQHVSKKHT